MPNKIFDYYIELRSSFHGHEGELFIYDILLSIYKESISILNNSKRKALTSLIPNKEYICFEGNGRRTRAINVNLIDIDEKDVNNFITQIKTSNLSSISENNLTKICYKIAIFTCGAIDILKKDDQKTPGTFFEYFIGQLFSTNLGVKPRKQVDILNIEAVNTKLPTDFIYDLGIGKPKYHVPVKTSTRERVIQVWAHQRVLDGVYGTGRFIGLLTCLGETKVDQKKLEVTEICLPDQWRIYQLFIAQMKRIYYLDLPNKYNEMNKWYL